MKRVIYLLICLAMVVVVSCTRGSSNESGGGSEAAGGGETGGGGDDDYSWLSSCSGSEFFSVSPLNSDDCRGIVPLGNLNPPGHTLPTDHVYMYARLSNPANTASDPASANVYSPGDLYLVRVVADEYVTDGYTDYSLTFMPCREFQGYFGHVQTLSDALSQKIGSLSGSDASCGEPYTTGGKTYRECSKNVKIEMKSGELIGTAGRKGQNALDFGAYDSRISALEFANPDRWSSSSIGFDKLHVVCPVNYFSSALKAELEAKFGEYDGSVHRTAEPLCGEVMQDIPGTAQGIWFISGTGDDFSEDAQLALAHGNVDPAQTAFSVGNSITGLDHGVYEFAPESSGLVNRDFGDITDDGSIYCFELTSSNVLILQLTSSTTLTIEKISAANCSAGTWSFSSNAVQFER